MTPEEQALSDLMPVIHEIVETLKRIARKDWKGGDATVFAALDLFMDIPKDSPVISLYREWLKCREEPKLAKQKTRSKRAPAEKD